MFYQWKKYYYEVKHKHIAGIERFKLFSRRYLLQKYFHLIKSNIFQILKYHKFSSQIKLNRTLKLWNQWKNALQNSYLTKKRKYLVLLLINGKEKRSNFHLMRRAYQFWRIKYRLSGIKTKRNSKLILYFSIKKWKNLILSKKHYNHILQLKSFKRWKERIYHILHTRNYIKNRQKYITRLLQLFKRKYNELLNQSFQHWCLLYGPEFEKRKQRQILEDIGIEYIFIHFICLFVYSFLFIFILFC